MRIYQLPVEVANQIAAGEVIESPASVVKELLENCLDAQATSIHIEIGYGGLNQIKISDNGVGILADDLPLALMPHATSKIKTLEDLYFINSMGFRGEALASIASVSQLSISSRPENQEHALMLDAQNNLTPCARNKGTTVEILDLFYNTPVRKKFLKTEKVEFQAIEKVIKRFALSALQISLTLKHNNKSILSLPAAISESAQQERVRKIFGSTFTQNAIYFEAEQDAMRLWGWISSPDFQRSQNDKQWVYVNQRMVKDKLINHALKQAYEGSLHHGRFPTCLLYFTLPSAEVDINVHPTKYEVRFQQPRLIHDFFLFQLRQALETKSWENKNLKLSTPELNQVNIAEAEEHYQVLNFEKVEFNAEAFALKSKNPEWIALNEDVVLKFYEQQPYLIDIKKLQRKWMLAELMDSELPLKSRPLLITTSYKIHTSSTEELTLLQEQLSLLGLNNLWVDNNLVINSIPLQLPFLNLALFIKLSSQLKEISQQKLIHLLTECQSFNLKLLSSEERLALDDFFILLLKDAQPEPGIFKALTTEICLEVLHE